MTFTFNDEPDRPIGYIGETSKEEDEKLGDCFRVYCNKGRKVSIIVLIADVGGDDEGSHLDDQKMELGTKGFYGSRADCEKDTATDAFVFRF